MGGKVLIGPSAADNNNVYVGIGDVGGHRTEAENTADGGAPDGTGGILRVTQDGKPVGKGILGNKYPLNKYYAYGIRNSFGLDFDPVTKKLWDTENGPSFGDEINLVNPGFDSGWGSVQGIWKPIGNLPGPALLNPNNVLEHFNGKGKYRAPELIYYFPTGLTAIKFLNSSKLGKQYKNDMFVGDFHNGNLYHFELNKRRTGLSLKGPLKDKIANDTKELQDVIFGTGFGGITDIQVGPYDGYLYVVSLYHGGGNCNPRALSMHCIYYNTPLQGAIFKIVPVAINRFSNK
jgi:glucose/arabinose dehydrogenase